MANRRPPGGFPPARGHARRDRRLVPVPAAARTGGLPRPDVPGWRRGGACAAPPGRRHLLPRSRPPVPGAVSRLRAPGPHHSGHGLARPRRAPPPEPGAPHGVPEGQRWLRPGLSRTASNGARPTPPAANPRGARAGPHLRAIRGPPGVGPSDRGRAAGARHGPRRSVPATAAAAFACGGLRVPHRHALGHRRPQGEARGGLASEWPQLYDAGRGQAAPPHG